MTATKGRILQVGIIGCGEVTQVVHIPTLGFLSDRFRITYLCDVSEEAMRLCQKKVIANQPMITRDPLPLCASEDVDVVFVLSSDEYHAPHTILALRHGKHVFLEKPMALNRRDADAIIEAEKKSKRSVMVGYMRRYAAGYLDALKELGDMGQISYARVRDIIGPNSSFISQSGTFPEQFHDYPPEDIVDRQKRAIDIITQGLEVECNVAVTPESTRMWRYLSSHSSHDLSAMREALGMPSGVIGASLGFPFWNVLFQYPGFVVNYESGVDNIPRFDAHLEFYSPDKTVRVQYDTPYVKGLPVTMHVQERVGDGLQERMVRSSYEDPYTVELKELYKMVVYGQPVKTTAEDAARDLEIFRMIVQKAYPSLRGIG